MRRRQKFAEIAAEKASHRVEVSFDSTVSNPTILLTDKIDGCAFVGVQLPDDGAERAAVIASLPKRRPGRPKKADSI